MAKFVLEDGRAFTDYRPNCIMNEQMQKGMDSHEYRMYLQKNAKSIMIKNAAKAFAQCQKCMKK